MAKRKTNILLLLLLGRQDGHCISYKGRKFGHRKRLLWHGGHMGGRQGTYMSEYVSLSNYVN